MEHRSNEVKSVEAIVAAIQALDLEPIKMKLVDREEGQGWSREYVEEMETAYKRFLTLVVSHPETQIAPTRDIDKFWHGHILDTKKYAEDCRRVFGYFLHHFPYLGMRGADDAAAHEQAAQQLHALYAQSFGEPVPSTRGAFCMATVDAKKEAGFCMAAVEAKQEASFCMATVEGKQAAAFCMATVDAKHNASFCMATVDASKEASFCMATIDAPQQSSAVLA